MGKKKSKKKSGGKRRANRTSGSIRAKSKGKSSSRRKNRKRKVETPKMDAVWMASAMVGGEVVSEAILVNDAGPLLPDIADPQALGLWAYAYWFRIPGLQQVAYAMEIAHVAADKGLIAELKSQVDKIRHSAMGAVGLGGGGDDSEDDSTPALEGATSLEEIVNGLDEVSA